MKTFHFWRSYCLNFCPYQWMRFISDNGRRKFMLNVSIFTRVRTISKKSISFFMSVCPSVRPSVRRHGIILLPLEGFSCNLIFAYFRKYVEKIHTLIKIWQSYGVPYMNTNINFWSYLTQLFLEWEMTHKSCRENNKKNACSIPSRNSCRLWDNVGKYGTAGQATDDDMVHEQCMLDT